MINHKLPFALLCPALALGITQALAQDDRGPAIEEIKVTADYRQSGIDQISSSITVLDEQLIQRRNAQHLEDLLFNAPNVNFASGASRARFYQIRGIGERGQYAEPLNPSVGLIIDGVDFSGIGNAALLYDVEQVEILLGPQGTRYGSNALAGLINLETKDPSTTPTYGVELQTANLDTRGVAGYLSGPINDRLAYRLSAQNIRSDGHYYNRYLNEHTNQRDESMLRGKLQWTASDNLEAEFTAALLDIDNGYDAFTLDNSRETLADEPGFDRQRSELLSTRLRYQGFERFNVEAIAGFADSDIGYGYDEDWIYEGFHPDEYSSIDHFFRDRETLSGELRLLSSDQGLLLNDSTSWVAGVYTLQQEVGLRRVYTWLTEDYRSQYDMDRFAAYAETNTRLGERWSLDLGLRAERFDAAYRDSDGLAFDPDDELFGGKLALNFHTANDNLLYLSASRGYKTGGFNTDGTLDADLREFDAESLWNYEFGFKGRLLDDRLSTRAALFYMDRDEVQISSSLVRMREDGSSEFIDFTGNAASGSNYGLELSADWLASDQLRLYGSLGLLESEYEDFVNSAGEDLDGREQAHAPNYQFTVGTEWRLAADLLLDLSLQGRDSFYFSDSHDAQSEAYELWNASLIYTLDNWRFTLWGRNLGDEDYFVRGYYFGNNPAEGYVDEAYMQLGEPRRYGLTVNYDF